MTERRRFPRRRALLSGRILIERLNGWTLDCAVRNVSAAGARIDLPRNAIVPQTFQLAISTGRPETARLVWYRDGRAGLALVDRSSAGEDDGESRRPLGEAGGDRPAAPSLRARMDAIAAGRRGLAPMPSTRPSTSASAGAR